MNYQDSDIDKIETHTRMAWALAELLIDHYGGQEEHNVMSDEIMAGLMENISSHLEAIQAVIQGEAAS